MTIREEIKAVNAAISGTLDLYAVWAKRYDLNYNELMVLYTLDDYKTCTQKQICDFWAIPKQTVHGILTVFEKNGYISSEINAGNKRERLISFTEKGLAFAQTILQPLYAIEEAAMQKMGSKQRERYVACNEEYLRLMKEEIENVR